MPINIPSYRIYAKENNKVINNVISAVDLGAMYFLNEESTLIEQNFIFADKKDLTDVQLSANSQYTPENSDILDAYYVVIKQEDSEAQIDPVESNLYRIIYNGSTYYYRYDEDFDDYYDNISGSGKIEKVLIKTYLTNPTTSQNEIIINDVYTTATSQTNIKSTAFYDYVGYIKRSEYEKTTAGSGFPTPYQTTNFDFRVNPIEGSVYKVFIYNDGEGQNKEWDEEFLIYAEGKFLLMYQSNGTHLQYSGNRNRYYLNRNISTNRDDEYNAGEWETNNRGSSYGVCIRLYNVFDRDYTKSMNVSDLKINATIKSDSGEITITNQKFIEYDSSSANDISSIDSDVFFGITSQRNAFESVFREGSGFPSTANMRGKKIIVSLCNYFDKNDNKFKYRLDILANAYSVRADGDNWIAAGATPITEMRLSITTNGLSEKEQNDEGSDNVYYYSNDSTFNQASNQFNDILRNEIIADYHNGKETAIIRVSLNDYYDTDGNLALSISDGNLPMLFKNGDIVIPYVATPNGDRPMSSNPDGTAKSFRVTGVTLISDGAIWQELQLQEVSG